MTYYTLPYNSDQSQCCEACSCDTAARGGCVCGCGSVADAETLYGGSSIEASFRVSTKWWAAGMTRLYQEVAFTGAFQSAVCVHGGQIELTYIGSGTVSGMSSYPHGDDAMVCSEPRNISCLSGHFSADVGPCSITYITVGLQSGVYLMPGETFPLQPARASGYYVDGTFESGCLLVPLPVGPVNCTAPGVYDYCGNPSTFDGADWFAYSFIYCAPCDAGAGCLCNWTCQPTHSYEYDKTFNRHSFVGGAWSSAWDIDYCYRRRPPGVLSCSEDDIDQVTSIISDGSIVITPAVP
jgi:hypothetical protein